MNLINAKGLNCYYSCIASIADYFDIDYRAACGTLWSENELIYKKKHQIYAPTRFIKNLEILGVKLIRLNAESCEKSAESIAVIGSAPDVVLVGMDAFHLPWSAIYQLRRGLHYFFGLKADGNRLICFDPLYQAKYVSLPYEYIAEHAFDILCVQKSNPHTLTVDIPGEAETVLRQHPFLLADLIDQVQSLESKPAEEGVLFAKYTDALLDNRLMFQEFLSTQVAFPEGSSLFTHALFAKWTAVKNGLYKMAITSNRWGTASSVCELLKELITEETSIARVLTVFAEK